MYDILLGSLLVISALIGGIAIWVDVKMTREINKPDRRPRRRPQAPTDPWSSVQRLRRGQRAL